MFLRQLSRVATMSVFLPAIAPAQVATKESPQFSFKQFHVPIYQGPLKVSANAHKDSQGAWRDDHNKLVEPPEVNFAGQYYLEVHSCGTGCRYYTLNSLLSGREYRDISMFDAGDPPPRTKDGHTYVPILFFKPDSRLLIAQYNLDQSAPVEQNMCRQRYYVFQNGSFRPLSKTLMSCTNEENEPE